MGGWISTVFCILRYLIPSDSPILKEYLVERICQRFQRIFSFDWLYFTFPNGDGVPAHCGEFVLNLQIPFLVPLYFADPKLCIGSRYSVIATAFMPMPKATIHKDTSSVLPHHNIGFPWQSWMVKPMHIPPHTRSHSEAH